MDIPKIEAKMSGMRSLNNTYSFSIIKFGGWLNKSHIRVSWNRKLLTKHSLSINNNTTTTSTYQPRTSIRHHSLHQEILSDRSHPHQNHSSTTKSAIDELVEKIIGTTLQKASSSRRHKMMAIDAIQRLGVGHYFEDEIRVVLKGFSDDHLYDSGQNLFDTALCFRLMRHNGLPTTSDVFDKFLDTNGEFEESLRRDKWGMLSLDEASHLAVKGEEKLLKAMEFTRSSLEHSMASMSPDFRVNVAKALALPRHLRVAALEARNYIDEYGQESDHIPDLLALAKLEFNELQSLHKRELAEIVRWWKQLGLIEKLDFARDRPFECFLWTVGIFPEASYSSTRIELAKTVCILLVIDDVFDSYGSLPELVSFNDAIKRWELSAIEQLPEYMKICYMALYNTTNEIAYRVLKEHGFCIVSELKRTWIDVIEAFLKEAEWYNSRYTPSVEEYLKNGVKSGGSYMALVHSFFLIGQGVTHETVSLVMNPYPHLFSTSAKILRLWDDLGTAKEEQERGDVASSIECYMKERNVESEDEAREHIRRSIGSLWLDLNAHLTKSQNDAQKLPNSITKACLNLARTAQLIYQHGDDATSFTVDHHVKSLFF